MLQEKAEPIPANVAEVKYGITCRHERMPNGELRFRLVSNDGSGYIRTVATSIGGWQNSHCHRELRETYIVQKGWMACAEFANGKRVLRKYGPGEIVTTRPHIVHNVYLPGAAVTHTVKHGKAQGLDWTPCPEFDSLTQNLTEDDINRLAGAD